MNFRKITLKSGTEILLGKDKEQNEILVKKFKGKNNIILHTKESGSPFCIIEKTKPSLRDVKEAAFYCAMYSQDWRDNKKNVKIHRFTGKDVYKRRGMETGTFGVKKYKITNIKKGYIEKISKNG